MYCIINCIFVFKSFFLLQLLGCLGKLKLIQGSYGGSVSVASACIISSAVGLSEATIAQFHNTTKSKQMIRSDDKKNNDDDDDDLNRLDALFGSIHSPTYSSDLNRSNFISFDALDDRGPLQVYKKRKDLSIINPFFDPIFDPYSKSIINHNPKIKSNSELICLSSP